MSYLKITSPAAAGRLGVRTPPSNATKFAGIPCILVSKFGSKHSNSGTTRARDRWFKRYADKNNARQRRASRNG